MDLAQILPQFGSFAFTLLAFVVALSIIVAIHEYGHYIVGRWSGIHAEVFSIGFGPVIWSREDRRGTRWQIAALPLGGYVKFLGDSNAASVGASDTDIRELDRRRTMLGAPLWARAVTVAAGPVFNFVLSFLIFAAIILVRGQAADPLTIAALPDLPPAYAQELRVGDEILAIDGRDAPGPDGFQAFVQALPAAPVLDYTVRRAGEEITVQGPHPYPPIVSGLNPRSAAYDAAMRNGDVITAVNGDPVWTFDQLREAVVASEGQSLNLRVWREGQEIDIALAPRRMDLPLPEGGFETRWLIGITGGLFFEPETVSPGLIASAGSAVAQVWYIIGSSLSGMWHMITGAISTCNISGPVGIAETSGAMASQGASSFIWFVAVLSTAVGLLNLFPVPVLDGGHLVFHAYEAVSGRPPSDRALRVLMAAGLSVLLTLMLFALANDLFLCR